MAFRQTNTLPKARRQIAATGVAPRALYEAVARTGAAVGAQRLILSASPAVTPEEFEWKAEELNRGERFAQTQGLKLACHNHWPEYKYRQKEIEGLSRATDPESVSFLLVPALPRPHPEVRAAG